MNINENQNWVPASMTEAEVLAVIDAVVSRLAPHFVNREHGLDDLKQVGRMEAIILLRKGKYSPDRPLEHYVCRHVRRRFQNIRRKLFRADCVGCPDCFAVWQSQMGTECGEHSPACRTFKSWLSSTTKKRQLAYASSLGAVDDNAAELLRDDRGHQEVEARDLREVIERRLPAALRDEYLKMLAGQKVAFDRRKKVKEAVRLILEGLR